MFCVALVREDPSCPNRSEALLFHGFVLAGSLHVHLFHVLDFKLHCFFTHFRRKRCTCPFVVVHVVSIGHLCRTRFFHCRSRFRRLQTTNSSQCGSQPTYHRQDTVLINVAPTVQLGKIAVYLFAIREESPPPVDTRHQKPISSHNALPSEENCQSVDV